MNILRQQYQLVLGSREAVLNFIETEVGQGLTAPLIEFNGSTVRYLLVHSANTYKHWAANFPMNLTLPYADELNFDTIAAIRELYTEADRLVSDFLEQFGDKLDVPVTNKTNSGHVVTTTPLELFSHMITHEYHHKGQIMTMCRLLGHIPPDTDLIRY